MQESAKTPCRERRARVATATQPLQRRRKELQTRKLMARGPISAGWRTRPGVHWSKARSEESGTGKAPSGQIRSAVGPARGSLASSPCTFPVAQTRLDSFFPNNSISRISPKLLNGCHRSRGTARSLFRPAATITRVWSLLCGVGTVLSCRGDRQSEQMMHDMDCMLTCQLLVALTGISERPIGGGPSCMVGA
jgi:hypothetical protein